MAKQSIIFTKIWQSKDLSLQKYDKAKTYLYKYMTK